MAEKADLHRNYIGEVERGEKTISVDALMRIALALKVSVQEFFPAFERRLGMRRWLIVKIFDSSSLTSLGQRG